MPYIEFAVFKWGLLRECCSHMRLAKSIRLKDGITAFPTLTNTRAGALPRQLKPWQWEGGWENRAKKSNDHGVTSAQKAALAFKHLHNYRGECSRQKQTDKILISNWFMQSILMFKKKKKKPLRIVCQKHRNKIMTSHTNTKKWWSTYRQCM